MQSMRFTRANYTQRPSQSFINREKLNRSTDYGRRAEDVFE